LKSLIILGVLRSERGVWLFLLLLFGKGLGQRRLTISHSPGLEAVASHHPELRMIQGVDLSVSLIQGAK